MGSFAIVASGGGEVALTFGRVLGSGVVGGSDDGSFGKLVESSLRCCTVSAPTVPGRLARIPSALYKHGMALAFWRMRVRGIRLARSKFRGPFFRPERCSSIESRRFRKPIGSYPNPHRGPEPAPPVVEELRYHVEPIRFYADGQGAAVPVLPDVGAQRCCEVSLSTF